MLGDAWGAAYATLYLGFATEDVGDIAAARSYFDASARAFRQLGDERYTLLATRPLAGTSYRLGDLALARALYEDIRSRARIVSDESIEAHSLGALAMIAADEGRATEAISTLREAHSIHRARSEHSLQTATDLCRFAYVLAFCRQPAAAAQLVSFAIAQYDGFGAIPRPFLVEINDRTLSTLRTQLDAASLAAAVEEGRALSFDEAAALASEALSDA